MVMFRSVFVFIGLCVYVSGLLGGGRFFGLDAFVFLLFLLLVFFFFVNIFYRWMGAFRLKMYLQHYVNICSGREVGCN